MQTMTGTDSSSAIANACGCRSAASWLLDAYSWIQPESRWDIVSPWSFQMLMGAPMARLATVITIGIPMPDGVVHGLHHVEQALAGRSPCRTGRRRRCADRPGHRGELRLDVDVLAPGQLAGLHQPAELLDDVRLWRDRVGADHLGPARGDGSRHGPRTLNLPEHERPPRRRAGRRPRRPPVGPGERSGEAFLEGRDDAVERDHPGQRGEGAEQGHVRHGATDVLHRQLGGGDRHDVAGRQGRGRRPEPELGGRPHGVDQHVAVGRHPGEHVDPSAAATRPG